MQKFLKGLAIGLLAGAAAGVLLAPKSGKETRGDIQEFIDDLQDKISDKVSRIKNLTAEKYNAVVDETVERYRQLNLSPEKRAAIKEELKGCFARIKTVVQEEE